MTNNTTPKNVTGTIKMKAGEWKYITSEPFCILFKDKKLIWNSLDTNIVQINPNSGLLYACDIGTVTVFATDVNETSIKVFCTIEVEASESSLKEQKLSAKSTSTVTTRCCDNGYGDITALGYSGTVFSYKIVGNRVTLEKGFGAKNGTSNLDSDLFRCALVKMDNIYTSMSPTQRGAWMELRINGFLDTIKSMLTSSPSDFLIGYIKDALVNYILPLDEIEALLEGFYPWYVAEQNAISCYQAF